MSDRRFTAAVALVGLVFVAAVYAPDVGHGFIKDDFRWLADVRLVRAAPSEAIFPSLPNFYRPVVTSTFLADYAVAGLDSRLYGFTNLLFYILCAAGIFGLLRAVGVGPPAAAVGAFAWAANPHGISMAVVWISGRTSLLVTLFAVLSLTAFLYRRRFLGSVLLFAALLSKEEAILLPVAMFAALLLLRPRTTRSMMLDGVALLVPVAAYFALRSSTLALTPWTVPSFYKPTWQPAAIAGNVIEYLDRGATFFAVIAAIGVAAYGWRGIGKMSLPLIFTGLAWFAGSYAMTVWLPVRSSLYAVLPSVGSAIACAAVLESLRDRAATRFGDRRLLAALAIVLVCIPIYRSRNGRWVDAANLSAQTMRVLTAEAPPEHSTGVVVFEDEAGPRATFDTALGSLASVAVQIETNRPLQALVTAPGHHWTGPCAARYRLTAGRVARVEE
ncbi:MAG TPA: hypothetical protein VH583_05885 [Vicinamibacterales bacterium]|jgi:hypothetical protein